MAAPSRCTTAFVLPPAMPSARRPIRELDPALEAERDRLADQLRAVIETDVHLTAEPSVLRRFDQYVAEIESEASSAPDGNLIAIVGARISWMAMRIAILLAVADGSQRVALSHLLRGIEITEPWRHNTLRVLGALAPSKFEKQVARIVQLVERKGESGVGRRDVMRSLRISKREMDDIESTVRERGDFRIASLPTAGGPSIVYTPTLSTLSRLSPVPFFGKSAHNAKNALGDNVDNRDNVGDGAPASRISGHVPLDSRVPPL